MKVRRTPSESKHSHRDFLLRSLPNESQASRRAGMVPRTVSEVPMAAPVLSWPGLALPASDKPTDENSLANPSRVAPVTLGIDAGESAIRHTFPGNSVTVIRVKGNRPSTYGHRPHRRSCVFGTGVTRSGHRAILCRAVLGGRNRDLEKGIVSRPESWGDKTAIELFQLGVASWLPEITRLLAFA